MYRTDTVLGYKLIVFLPPSSVTAPSNWFKGKLLGSGAFGQVSGAVPGWLPGWLAAASVCYIIILANPPIASRINNDTMLATVLSIQFFIGTARTVWRITHLAPCVSAGWLGVRRAQLLANQITPNHVFESGL